MVRLNIEIAVQPHFSPHERSTSCFQPPSGQRRFTRAGSSVRIRGRYRVALAKGPPYTVIQPRRAPRQQSIGKREANEKVLLFAARPSRLRDCSCSTSCGAQQRCRQGIPPEIACPRKRSSRVMQYEAVTNTWGHNDFLFQFGMLARQARAWMATDIVKFANRKEASSSYYSMIAGLC